MHARDSCNVQKERHDPGWPLHVDMLLIRGTNGTLSNLWWARDVLYDKAWFLRHNIIVSVPWISHIKWGIPSVGMILIGVVNRHSNFGPKLPKACISNNEFQSRARHICCKKTIYLCEFNIWDEFLPSLQITCLMVDVLLHGSDRPSRYPYSLALW